MAAVDHRHDSPPAHHIAVAHGNNRMAAATSESPPSHYESTSRSSRSSLRCNDKRHTRCPSSLVTTQLRMPPRPSSSPVRTLHHGPSSLSPALLYLPPLSLPLCCLLAMSASVSTVLFAVVCLLLLASLVRCQPSLPDMPSPPGMGGDADSDSYTVYQMMPAGADVDADEYDTADFYTAAGFEVLQLGELEDGQTVALGKKGSFTMPRRLSMQEAAPQYETLPTVTKATQYLKPVIRTTYVDQDIIQPKTIVQPVLQQRILQQPIIRTRVVKQPIRRSVISKSVIRPHLITQTRIVPRLTEQTVLQPKITEQTIVKEEFNQDYQTQQPVTQKATVQGKAPQAMYGGMPNYAGY